MQDTERKEKEAALALALLELVQSKEPEAEARQAAHRLIEALDEIDRKLEGALDEIARLKGWNG